MCSMCCLTALQQALHHCNDPQTADDKSWRCVEPVVWPRSPVLQQAFRLAVLLLLQTLMYTMRLALHCRCLLLLLLKKYRMP